MKRLKPDSSIVTDPVSQPPKLSGKELVVVVTGDDLHELRQELDESLTEFGLTLKRAIDPKAKQGFTRQYISRLEHGQDVITDEIKRGFLKIAMTFDGTPGGLAGAENVTVLAQPNEVPPGTLIPEGAEVIKCHRPGCNVWFLKLHHLQIYHHPSCRQPWD